ncbi:MAG TPA: hypothetical protein VD707_09690 [Gemmatimonadales bacterium]|nr:hypothetical protein [Gemmatimonadales bacterium]
MTRRTGAVMARAGPAALLCLLLACGHEAPFRPDSYGSDTPFSPGSLARLTLNRASDRTPAWTPDGAGLWYSVARTDRPDGDHCLGRLPPDGGARVETRCQSGLAAEDSNDVLEVPSAAADGRLAYVHIAGAIGALTPYLAELVVAPPGGGAPVRRLGLPYAPPGRRGYDRASRMQWVGGDTLVFLAEAWLFSQDKLAGTIDTTQTGLGVERLPPGGTPERVPLTEFASSVTAGDTAGVLYLTFVGDSRVIRLAGGDTATVHDFGALGIARDVQVRAGRLVAVVGGDVVVGYSVSLQMPLQFDEGGYLYVVDLADGARVQLPDTAFRYRRPALSPDGRRVVAEVMTPQGEDLWAIALP